MLEANLQGVRDDLVEVVIDPGKLASYGLRPDMLIAGFAAGNQLVAAGALEGAKGRYAIKVPSLIETPEDVANLPVVADRHARRCGSRDIADILPTLKDPETITRLDGQPGRRDRGVEAHRRQPDRDGRRGEGGRRRVPHADARRASRSPSARTSRRTSASCCSTCRTRS